MEYGSAVFCESAEFYRELFIQKKKKSAGFLPKSGTFLYEWK